MIERSWVRVPAEVAGDFSSPGSTFCADSYFGICSTPVLLQQHVKDPGHSAKSAGGMHPMDVALHEVTWHGAWLHGVHRPCRYSSSFTWHQPYNNQTALYVHPFSRYSKYAVKS